MGAQLKKAIAALVPLEELAGRGGAGRSARGAGTAAEPSGTVRQVGAKRRNSARRRRDRGGGGSDGPLPFTGLALAMLALAGAGLVLVGGPLRRATRASAGDREGLATQPVPPPALPVPGRSVRTSRARSSSRTAVRVAGVAALGVVGLAVLASHRRA